MAQQYRAYGCEAARSHRWPLAVIGATELLPDGVDQEHGAVAPEDSAVGVRLGDNVNVVRASRCSFPVSDIS